MKISFSALALLLVLALVASASPSAAASSCGSNALLTTLSTPAVTPASIFGGTCSGTCTVTCDSGASYNYYNVSPLTCCGRLNMTACPDGSYPTSTEFWPTFSTDPGGCVAEIC